MHLPWLLRMLLICALIVCINLIILLVQIPSPMQKSDPVDEHQLCIVFPYRNRFDALNIVVPSLNKFLQNQSISPFKFLVVNQTDGFRFNRGSLINIGAQEAKEQNCDYIAIHDADIVPLNPKLDYSFPGRGQLRHITSGKYHPIARYDYKNYIGGVLLITLEDFYKVNGMSNNFWGWGLEDDEFFLRLKTVGMADNILRPNNLDTNRTSTFSHVHHGKRDYRRSEYRKRRLQGRDKTGGLTTLQFTLTQRHSMDIEGVEVLVLDVLLHCDTQRNLECL